MTESNDAAVRDSSLGRLRVDNVQAYLPGDRRRALAAGLPMPDRVRGCALFGDISGFTAFAESLAIDFGPQRGAEELTEALDAVFGPLLDELDRYGGDVIYFSGDAVTAWIDGDDGLVGVACALALQQVIDRVGLRVTPSGREFRLGLKVAVAAGTARRFVVGDPDVQLIDVLAGAVIDRLAAAERLARPGDVVVDAGTAAVLTEQVRFSDEPRGDAVRLVEGLGTEFALPTARPPCTPLPDEVVRQWLLPSVYERMSAGKGEFLAELRPAIPLFVRFGGIDYDDDPDAVTSLNELVTTVQRVVAANGGNVLQLTIGDKGAYLYAVFGSPVAHENDAARACASALQLLRVLPGTNATGVRIGISAGRLRSGSYGSSERRTFSCLGDPVNLAARLMSAAPDGGILVSAEAQRAAGHGFDWGELRRLQVAGKSADVAVAPLLGEGKRTAAQSARGAAVAPLVGRNAEFAQLCALATDAIDGSGQVVVVSGPGGVGKSRLLGELESWLVEHGVRVRSGAASSFGPQTSYGVWRDLCRDAWGIEADASTATVVERLREVLLGVDSELLARLPLLGPLLGVSIPDSPLTATFDAKLRKTSLESLIVTLLTANAARGPIAFLIDAAEHLDELSMDLVEAIGRLAPRVAVLVVIGLRTSGSADATPLASLRHAHEVVLANLDAQASRALVRNHLHGDLADAVLDRLGRLAGGNPFHLEELVNYLVDRGIDPAVAAASDISLPTSLHSLELARIDELAEAPRRTLKVASVVGIRFEIAVVAGSYPELGAEAEVGRYALNLADAALVVPEGETVYAFVFRNETTQQVAYETLTFSTREALHDRVVGWLEAHLPDDDAAIDVLAFHAARGTDADRKRDYVVRAGIAAQARYANDAAVEYFTTALDLLESADQAAIRRRLGKVLEILGRWAEAEETYHRAIELYGTAGDPPGQAHARADLAEVARKQGRFDEARALLAQADEAFVALDDRDGRATVLHLQGTIASQQADYDSARDAYEVSLEIRRDLHDLPKIGSLLSNLAVVAEQVGDYASARELNESALAVREQVGDPWAIAVSQNNLGMIALLQEDFARATGHIEASVALAQRVGDRWIVAVGQHNYGIAQRGLGEFGSSGQAFLAALQAYVDYDDRWSLTLLVEDVVFLATDTGQDHAAIALVAVADRLRADLDAPRPPNLVQQLDAVLAPARTRTDGSFESDASDIPDASHAAAELVREVCRAAQA